MISPLVSLIHDQVTKLNGMNISADHLSGDDYNRFVVNVKLFYKLFFVNIQLSPKSMLQHHCCSAARSSKVVL